MAFQTCLLFEVRVDIRVDRIDLTCQTADLVADILIPIIHFILHILQAGEQRKLGNDHHRHCHAQKDQQAVAAPRLSAFRGTNIRLHFSAA